MEFGYRLLRGRGGAGGHIRDMGKDRLVAVRGLRAGAACVLYALDGNDARACGCQTADGEGQARLSAALPGRLYVTADGRIVAWEDGDDAEETYCRACAQEEKRRRDARPRAAEAKEEKPAQAKEELAEAAPLPGAASPVPPAPREEILLPPEPAERYALRPPGAGEPVDALPELIWPPAARSLRDCFQRGRPFAPFHAPGWRFVRAPSRVPGAAYCAVGYQALDGRVARVAWAVPGPPQRPPLSLPGARYRKGAKGMGYWVTEKSV